MGIGLTIAPVAEQNRAATPPAGSPVSVGAADAEAGAGLRAAVDAIGIPAAAFVVALLLFGVFIAFTGRNPLAVYYQMYRGSFGTWFSFQNTLLRAAVLARGRTLVPEDFVLAGQARSVTAEVLPLEDAVRHRLGELLEGGSEGVQDLYNTLISAVERPLIEVVLERAGGNQVKAADMLGINRNTLRKKITELGVAIRRSVGGPLG